MKHCCRRRPEQDDEHDRRTDRQRRQYDTDDNCSQQEVQDEESPGLVIEVGCSDTQGTRQAHPFTPDAATPATK
jgi:hypothetical protein